MGRKKGGKNKITKKELKVGCEQIAQKYELPVKANEALSTDKIELTKEQQEKKGKLDNTLRELNKSLGKESIKYANTIEERNRLSFGHKSLDKLTGGIPAGTYITIWGGKGSGKSTIVLDLIANTQKLDKVCVYINGERSYDPVWAKKRGVNTEKLIVIDVETIEEGLDCIIKLCREKVADLIIFDSIHGLAPKGELYEGKAEKEKSVEQDTMALRARKLTQFFEMATSFVADAKCAVVLIGQSRMDLSGFIKLETLTGGHALMHFSRLILRVRRGQGADAPTEKRETEEIDEKGKKVKETVKIGFDLVVHVDKSQLQGCTEGNAIHLPFYFLEGIKEDK
jgi:RecA/RadA recombinase